ncbi:MAG: hypothetical protein RLZZ142_2189 [Verrucomicrobiota bacterium]|jgi:heptosyltransferase-2
MQSAEPSAASVLFIRGGALGDFVLTLPALRLLRDAFPGGRLELLGYPHIAALALAGGQVDAVRSIEYGPMAGFFAREGTLDPSLCQYFAGFDHVVSCLYDPDRIFEANLRRAGVRGYLSAYRKVTTRHAAWEWAAPLEELGLCLRDPAPRVELGEADREAGRKWLGGAGRARLALHPGSGSPRKNWPVAGWMEVARRFLRDFPEGELVLVGGEADEAVLRAWSLGFGEDRVRTALHLPLPLLAAVLGEIGRFAGHDSGVSHVAAAVGARCVLLFGPTDPALWAPQNAGVEVIGAPEGDWSRLLPGQVWERIVALF